MCDRSLESDRSPDDGKNTSYGQICESCEITLLLITTVTNLASFKTYEPDFLRCIHVDYEETHERANRFCFNVYFCSVNADMRSVFSIFYHGMLISL